MKKKTKNTEHEESIWEDFKLPTPEETATKILDTIKELDPSVLIEAFEIQEKEREFKLMKEKMLMYGNYVENSNNGTVAHNLSNLGGLTGGTLLGGRTFTSALSEMVDSLGSKEFKSYLNNTSDQK